MVAVNVARNAVVYRLFDQVLNLGDIGDLGEILSPHCKNSTSLVAGLPLGIAGFAPFVALLRDVFAPLYIEIKDQFTRCGAEAEELVESFFGLEGVHRGEIFGVEATGKSLALPGRYTALVRTGRIVEHNFELEVAVVLEQLQLRRIRGQQ